MSDESGGSSNESSTGESGGGNGGGSSESGGGNGGSSSESGGGNGGGTSTEGDMPRVLPPDPDFMTKADEPSEQSGSESRSKDSGD